MFGSSPYTRRRLVARDKDSLKKPSHADLLYCGQILPRKFTMLVPHDCLTNSVFSRDGLENQDNYLSRTSSIITSSSSSCSSSTSSRTSFYHIDNGSAVGYVPAIDVPVNYSQPTHVYDISSNTKATSGVYQTFRYMMWKLHKFTKTFLSLEKDKDPYKFYVETK